MKRIFIYLTALLALLPIYAQDPDKALIVTLRDGTKAEYLLSDIEHLTFDLPTIPMGQPTTGPYAVGDYWCDGTNQGVVITVDATGSYGTIAALRDAASKVAWSTEWEITGANNLTWGPANMETVAAVDPTYEKYPAFKVCAAQGEGWYLPAQKELQNMRSQFSKVQDTFVAHGGTKVDVTTAYWSSTEADQYMDAMAFTCDMDFPGIFGEQKQLLKPVRAFREFGDAPKQNYVVGNYYEADDVKGVIVWVDPTGEYARILSLTEQETQWGPTGTRTGATSQSDGEANTAKATGEAFLACTSQGQGWYLPAIEELTALQPVLNIIGPTIIQHQGEPLAESSGYYWSSTEHASDGANTAMAALLASASQLSSSKNITRYVRAMRYIGNRPQAPSTYAVGDIYKEGDKAIGIVSQINADGTHGTIIALKDVAETGRINAMWDKRADASNYVTLGASSTTDGQVNLNAARADQPLLADLNAFRVATELGDGWYLAAKDEMLAVANAKEILNAALTAAGGSKLDNGEYWTSTEGSADPAQRATSVKISDGSTFDYRKYMYLRVRPMKKF